MDTLKKRPLRRRHLLATAVTGALSLLGAASALAQVNILENSDFETGEFPWENSIGWGGVTSAFTAQVENGEYCLNVTDPGGGGWHVTLRQAGLDIAADAEYTYEFAVHSSASGSVFVQFDQGSEENYNLDNAGAAHSVGGTSVVSGTFDPSSDYSGVEFVLQMGGTRLSPGTEICFDDFVLNCSTCEPEEPKAPALLVHVNQAGYLPELEKVASYAVPLAAVNKSTPRVWRLLEGSREEVTAGTATEVATGSTSAVGEDSASGDYLHTIDFSGVGATGPAFVLEILEGAEQHFSPSFAIQSDVYSAMKYDALAYFYHNRAGSAVDASLVGADLARAAGHEYDNNLDTKGCVDNSFECRTGVDAGGGWYDAGDHGKYVVNGGISVWTMLNQYERALHLGANAGDFADGTMAIPEAGNGTADILDEARYEIEWMLKMQIPAGYENAGMVYHKLHDDSWTASAFNPATATASANPRHIWAPSTAATLNFAAIGAQCYRVYKDIDTAFANECLSKAKTAYDAAQNTAYLRAPYTSPSGDGGGQYEDLPGDRTAASASYVQDEFYWAATELYIAANIDSGTDASGYAADMTAATSLHLQLPSADPQTSMTWAHVSGLGVMSLATAGETAGVDSTWISQARTAITNRADTYVAASEGEGYGVPFNVDTVYWGSNSNVLNNALVMGLARDFTGCTTDAYLETMNRAMGYLMGHNPMGTAYVTGYGEKSVQNPHHRYWSNSQNSSFPTPPPGVLVGGPNAGMEDPIALALLDGCSPLKCYVDELEAYSTNEITINWNTPLAWVSAYLDEAASGALPQACGGLVAEDAALDIGEASSGTLDLATINNAQAGDTFVIVEPPEFGTATIDANGVLTYSVDVVSGVDTLTYEFQRGTDVSTEGTISITTSSASPLSCTWQVVQDVDAYNSHWNAEVLLENNTAQDVNGWELAITVGADSALGSEWYQVPGYTLSSGSVTSGGVWSVVDSGWNGSIPAGGNMTLTVTGYDPTVKHWEPGFNGYTPANITSIGGDCGTPAEKTVDIISLEGGENGAFTGDDFVTLSWFNNSGQDLHILDEQGNRLDLTARDDGVWIIPQGNWTRMEARVHRLRELTSLDMSPGTHTWTVASDTGLASETSDPVSITISGDPVLRCDVGVQTRYSDGDWLGSFSVTNTSDQAVTDWSLVLEWPSEDYLEAPAAIQNVFSSTQYNVVQEETWRYRLESNGVAIAPGATLSDVYHGHVWSGSDSWAISDPVVIAEPGGNNCY
ncbi:glycoside hydrolase family 9 protein [Gilvimarinus sp. SDUM040013]|uniref:Endoglucanase n=1 Tax=Gilvimarinus gilvus TaxID=3058038 RepID=A0ABU4RUC8_9GAMM|nr:glycoside hydrolase family 9 protein [Gilvimarinus sp. SDUM040013]MDO3386801.1 glycoside hydrolase family 9 protein [Gilvimarinus sp. SDUM040013]MDX6848269.1 glycoside hydrolase family 9 protein [Gilvimarinus sp. SDUM040013]